MTEIELLRRFVKVTNRLSEPKDMSTKLWGTVELAAQTVPGCDYAGITLIRRRAELRSPAYSAESVLEVDRHQYELDEGPCLDTARNGETYLQVDDLASDGRWPRFAARAAELGVASVLSCPLDSPRGISGALNLYSDETGAFDTPAREVALLFASHAGMLLATSRMEESLRTAIDSREHIGMAVGILMQRHKVTGVQAFEMLSKVSQETNTKVRDLATRLIDTGEEPGSH